MIDFDRAKIPGLDRSRGFHVILHAGSFLTFCGHHGGPPLRDRSSPILRQYEPPHDHANLNHPEISKSEESNRAQYSCNSLILIVNQCPVWHKDVWPIRSVAPCLPIFGRNDYFIRVPIKIGPPPTVCGIDNDIVAATRH